jgi:hypothetical protein
MEKIYLFLTVVSFIGCEQPVIMEPEIITEQEETMEDEITESENDDSEQNDIPEKPEEEKLMELQAFNEYLNYFVDGSGAVFGIAYDRLERITFKDTEGEEIGNPADFFVIDDAVYLSFNGFEVLPDDDPVPYQAVLKMYYFKQYAEVVTTLGLFPNKPEAVTVELNRDPFRIVNEDWKGLPISGVWKDKLHVTYLPINGAFVNDDGLWFHVSETYNANRKGGLYFWATDAKGPRHKNDIGRLW